jgi:hypothetical protein
MFRHTPFDFCIAQLSTAATLYRHRSNLMLELFQPVHLALLTTARAIAWQKHNTIILCMSPMIKWTNNTDHQKLHTCQHLPPSTLVSTLKIKNKK